MALVQYIDDLLIAAKDFATLKQAQAIIDELAVELGVEFKEAKDEGLSAYTTELEFLGILLSTTERVEARPPALKVGKICEELY